MNENVFNQVPYLRTSRDFPTDIQQLTIELYKSYLDIANAVNNRTIGIFPPNKPAVTGENWYLSSQRQQALRQFYQFTATGNIPHGLNLGTIAAFTKCQGSFTDGTNYYGAIYASNTAIAGQVSFYITPNNIVVLAGAGAPSITSGLIVLEWISQV